MILSRILRGSLPYENGPVLRDVSPCSSSIVQLVLPPFKISQFDYSNSMATRDTLKIQPQFFRNGVGNCFLVSDSLRPFVADVRSSEIEIAEAILVRNAGSGKLSTDSTGNAIVLGSIFLLIRDPRSATVLRNSAPMFFQ